MKKDEKDGRVRRNTSPVKNAKIDKITEENIEKYAQTSVNIVTDRIRSLNKKWDMERTLEVNMATLALTGIALSVFVSRKWLLLPSVVLGFFVQHAIQGWCPPLPVFRALKVRTRAEIDEEKYALKALRGDFSKVENPKAAFDAVKQS